jgi:hypothetical protein
MADQAYHINQAQGCVTDAKHEEKLALSAQETFRNWRGNMGGQAVTFHAVEAKIRWLWALEHFFLAFGTSDE